MFWYVQEVVLILPKVGLPASLGQCRGQPGELKNHSLDGFSPASERAAPFVSLPLFIPKTKQTPLWVSVLFGGEKGIPPGTGPVPTPARGAEKPFTGWFFTRF